MCVYPLSVATKYGIKSLDVSITLVKLYFVW